eukprot:11640133-Alexandrium_andersonii.AAC.1
MHPPSRRRSASSFSSTTGSTRRTLPWAPSSCTLRIACRTSVGLVGSPSPREMRAEWLATSWQALVKATPYGG